MHTDLQQRGRLAGAERVDGSPLRATACCEGRPQGVLDTVAGPGCGGRGQADPSTTWSREEPDRMAVGCPVLAQQLECPLEQGDIAVLGAFARAYVDEHPGTVNIGDLEISNSHFGERHTSHRH